MKKQNIIIAVLAFLYCISAQSAELTSSCEENFKSEGGFFNGSKFKTWQEIKGVTFDAAFKKVAQTTAANSWGTVNTNKEAGIITASQTVTSGQGATAPLNIIIQEKEGGVIRVDINFSTSFGQVASADTGKVELCKLANAPAQ